VYNKLPDNKLRNNNKR